MQVTFFRIIVRSNGFWFSLRVQLMPHSMGSLWLFWGQGNHLCVNMFFEGDVMFYSYIKFVLFVVDSL